MSQYLEHPAETDKANVFTVGPQLFDDGISFGSTAVVEVYTGNLGGGGSTDYIEIRNFSSHTDSGRLYHHDLGNQSRLIHAIANIAGRTAAYWFGLDSFQEGYGLVFEANPPLLKICSSAASPNSESYVPNITLGETSSGSTVPTLSVLGKQPPVRSQPGGAATAGGSYSATEQVMLQKTYDAMRAFGFLT